MKDQDCNTHSTNGARSFVKRLDAEDLYENAATLAQFKGTPSWLTKLSGKATSATPFLEAYDQSFALYTWDENSKAEARTGEHKARLSAVIWGREVSKDECEILWTFTLPELRGQGLQRQLWNSLLSGPWRHKYLWLEVAATNLPAMRLYKSVGFLNNRIRKAYYPDGQDAWEMKKAALASCL